MPRRGCLGHGLRVAVKRAWLTQVGNAGALLLLVMAVLGISLLATAARESARSSGQAVAAQEWCLSDDIHTQQAAQAGRLWLGMRWYSEDERVAMLADPRWSTACAAAHQLWGLTNEEWDWCWKDEHRRSALAPAVTFLGLGRDEALGTETFLEAPGDDPAEYTQACRFAYRFWRSSPVGTDPGPAIDAFLAVDPDKRDYCDGHPSRVTQASQLLQVDAPTTGDSISARLAFARACSFAAVIAGADALPVATPTPSSTMPPQGEAFLIEVLFVNHSKTAIQITERVGGVDSPTVVIPSCGAVRINGEPRKEPWSMQYAAAALSDAEPILLIARDEVAGDRLKLVVTIESEGAGSAEAVSVVPALPDGSLCGE